MTWMQTRRGRAVSMTDPQPDDVDLDEVAHALGMLCRYNGHTSRFYSVAEHCVHVSRWLLDNYGDPTLALAGLLHDASEAYTGDLTWPVQRALPPEAVAAFKAMQGQFDDLIADAAGVPRHALHVVEVKEADTRILVDERDALLGPPPQPWFADELGPLGVTIYCWGPSGASGMWRATCDHLQRLRGGR